MTLPNFFLIGPTKSGTTSLYHYLGQHPDIFMPAEKEPFYFSHYFPRGLDWYEPVFTAAAGEKRVGEASTTYFASDSAPGRIRKTLPEAKLVFVLRDPVDRAWSEYRYSRVVGAVSPSVSFRRFATETRRVLEWGRYIEYLPLWEREFPDDQRLVLLFDDLRSDTKGSVRRIFEFLGVDPAFEPKTERRHNVTPSPRHIGLYVFLQRHWLDLHRMTRGTRLQSALENLKAAGRAVAGPLLMERRTSDRLSPEDERWLRELFAEPNRRLAEHLGRDLSAWEKPAAQ